MQPSWPMPTLTFSGLHCPPHELESRPGRNSLQLLKTAPPQRSLHVSPLSLDKAGEAPTNGNRRSLTAAVLLNSGNSFCECVRIGIGRLQGDTSLAPPFKSDNWTAASQLTTLTPAADLPVLCHLGDPNDDRSSNPSAPALDVELSGRLPWDHQAHDGSAC